MNKVWIVAKETYKRNTLNFSFFLMLFLPLFAALFFIAIGYFTSGVGENAGAEQALTVVVPDAATEQALETMTDRQENGENLEINYLNDEQQAREALNNKDISNYLVIDRNADDLLASYYSQASEPDFQSDYPAFYELLNNSQALLSLDAFGVTPEVYERVLNREVPVENISLQSNNESLGGERIDTIISFAISLILMFLVFMYIAIYGNLIIQNLADEKGSRIMEILLSTMTATQNFYGKLLGVLMMIFTQVAFYALFAAGFFWFFRGTIQQLIDFIPAEMWQNISYAVLWSLIYGVFGIVMYSVLAAFIGSLATRKEDAQKAATPLSILEIVGFYIGLFGMMRVPDSILLKIASHIPFFAPNIMPLRIAKNQVSAVELGISVLINIVFIGLILHISTTLYKTNVLSYSDEGVWQTFKRSLTLNVGERKNK